MVIVLSCTHQRWSPRGRPWPRGHILKSLALALASRPQVLENWPYKNFCEDLFFGDCLKNFCEDLFFFFGDRLKIFCEDLFFFWRALALVSLVLALSIPVLGLESVCPRKGCPWPWPRIFFVSLALASSLVSSTPPLVLTVILCNNEMCDT